MTLLATVAAIYLGLMILLLAFETRFIFFPNFPGRLTGDWNPPGLPVEDVWLTASDGVRIHAWWIPATNAEFTFIMFHGNAANLPNRADIYRAFHTLPANVLAVEYRGYGKSEGAPSEAGIYLDARAAHDYLTRERAVPQHRIVAFGASLGSAVAADLAAERDVAALVLEAPFASAAAVARRVYPFLPGLGRFIRSKFDTLSKVKAIRAPLLVVHCTRDPVIAPALGQAVFDAANEPKHFLRIEAACHEDAMLANPAPYRAALLDFLGKLKR
ncbi:MAG: alpha/beta hydrolase [Candidatus Acidiferrales bacterium]